MGGKRRGRRRRSRGRRRRRRKEDQGRCSFLLCGCGQSAQRELWLGREGGEVQTKKQSSINPQMASKLMEAKVLSFRDVKDRGQWIFEIRMRIESEGRWGSTYNNLAKLSSPLFFRLLIKSNLFLLGNNIWMRAIIWEMLSSDIVQVSLNVVKCVNIVLWGHWSWLRHILVWYVFWGQHMLPWMDGLDESPTICSTGTNNNCNNKLWGGSPHVGPI